MHSVVSNPNPQFVKPLIQQPVVQYVSNTRGGVAGHSEAYGGAVYQRQGPCTQVGLAWACLLGRVAIRLSHDFSE